MMCVGLRGPGRPAGPTVTVTVAAAAGPAQRRGSLARGCHGDHFGDQTVTGGDDAAASERH